MTTASPTPFAASSAFGHPRSQQQARRVPVRPPVARSLSSRHSPLSSLSNGHGFSADAPALQNFSIGDSSDDELPQPMHFSALTKAILEDKASARSHSPHASSIATSNRGSYHENGAAEAVARGATPPSRHALRISRRPSPQQNENAGSPQRIVHLGSSQGSRSLRRAASSHERRRPEVAPPAEQHQEMITPAPRPRAKSTLSSGTRASSPQPVEVEIEQEQQARSSSRTRSNYHSSSSAARSRTGSSRSASQHQDESAAAPSETHDEQYHERSKPASDAVTGSMRLKRVPVGSGTFLRGAPMRRGIRRRPSDDHPSPVDDEAPASALNEEDVAPSSRTPDRNAASSVPRGTRSSELRGEVNAHDFAPQPSSRQQRTAWVSAAEDDVASKYQSASKLSSSRKTADAQQQPMFKVPPPLTSAPNADQENEPPPTFKRNKPQAGIMLGGAEKPVIKASVKEASPQRPALVQMSSNTPARPAPPPPKMSMLETATAAGGAATTKTKKKRSHVLVNGKMFTIRGRLGRGGSSEVYKVMAENDKMFALKRVNLEDCNEETVRGFKGEIDLLKKLENVDRVVRLIDWEVNSQKQTLNVLMEMGETDFNHVLGHRLHAEDAKLDLSFTRHYWREMLSCVQAVHDYDIVHSDLKPANFLMVQGRLKLIDFGIANAIDIENTVNVHRETNVGTPNYMSPESLQDTNGGERAPGSAKLMKLGKPSDVWSLGCILYQMVYGKPPFAYIANQWNRIMAIINPSVAISYPTTGIGDVYVPSTLRRLLQRCLNRDPAQRPSIPAMLSEKDSFLHPDAERDGAVPMTEELLGQILQRVVDRCRDTSRGIPSDEALRTYPKGFLDNIRASLER